MIQTDHSHRKEMIKMGGVFVKRKRGETLKKLLKRFEREIENNNTSREMKKIFGSRKGITQKNKRQKRKEQKG